MAITRKKAIEAVKFVKTIIRARVITKLERVLTDRDMPLTVRRAAKKEIEKMLM